MKNENLKTRLLPDHPSKAEYAAKYEWDEVHSEECECLYCVGMLAASEKREHAVRVARGIVC